MNYGELRTHFTKVLNRRDLTASLRDSFLQMGIARIQRELRAPFMEKSVIVTISEDYDGLEIPSDYLALVAITCNGVDLQRVDLGVAKAYEASGIGTPKVFARQGGSWVLGPTPAQGDTVRIDYYGEVGELSEDDDENTLTIIAWDLITYSALVLAAEYFLDRRLETFDNRYNATLAQLQGQSDFDELSHAVMRPCSNMDGE